MNEQSKSAAVVAAWFGGNSVLAAILPAFGERAFAVVLFTVSTALPALAAVLVLVGHGSNAEPEQQFTLAANAVWALPAALGLVLIGVGAISSIWLTYVGGIAVLTACVQLLRPPDRTRAEVADAE